MKISNLFHETMSSPYKDYLIGFIEQKKALGFKFESQTNKLIHFDRFASENPDASSSELSEKIVRDWVESPVLNTDQKRRRGLLIHQFGEYLQQIGVTAFLYPKRRYKAPARYLPYIFTHEQIATIFHQADKTASEHSSVVSCVDTALILRMLYGCGLRISEALNLRVRDVDFVNGVFHIWDSKFQKDRTTPMSDSLLMQCKDFFNRYVGDKATDAYLFSPDGTRRYSSQTIYNRFRDILFYSGIPHRGKGKGPRLHDLRHTFAVHSLRRLSEQGEDLYTVLPVLSEYMGHSSVSATQYYLRLTAEIYPDITGMVDLKYGDIYPEEELQ